MTRFFYVKLALIALFTASAAQAELLTYTISLSAAELQAKIEPAFTPNYGGQLPIPLTNERLAIQYTLSNPVITLVRGSDRVGLLIDVELTLPFMQPIKGKGRMNSGVEYRREEYAFYLKDPQIESLNFEGKLNKYEDLVRKDIQQFVNLRYAKSPVYIITNDSTQKQVARLVLRNIVVNEQTGMLDVTLGL